MCGVFFGFVKLAPRFMKSCKKVCEIVGLLSSCRIINLFSSAPAQMRSTTWTGIWSVTFGNKKTDFYLLNSREYILLFRKCEREASPFQHEKQVINLISWTEDFQILLIYSCRHLSSQVPQPTSIESNWKKMKQEKFTTSNKGSRRHTAANRLRTTQALAATKPLTIALDSDTTGCCRDLLKMFSSI